MPYAATLGLELIAASKEEVHAAVEWDERLTTAAGILHGGVLMGLGRHRRRLLRVSQPAGGLDVDGHDRVEDELLLGRPLGASRRARGRSTAAAARSSSRPIFDESGKHVARVTRTQAML